jgi:hypothetical protein
LDQREREVLIVRRQSRIPCHICKEDCSEATVTAMGQGWRFRSPLFGSRIFGRLIFRNWIFRNRIFGKLIFRSRIFGRLIVGSRIFRRLIVRRLVVRRSSGRWFGHQFALR